MEKYPFQDILAAGGQWNTAKEAWYQNLGCQSQAIQQRAKKTEAWDLDHLEASLVQGFLVWACQEPTGRLVKQSTRTVLELLWWLRSFPHDWAFPLLSEGVGTLAAACRKEAKARNEGVFFLTERWLKMHGERTIRSFFSTHEIPLRLISKGAETSASGFTDGVSIQLAPKIEGFHTQEDAKTFAAMVLYHEIGHILFGSFERVNFEQGSRFLRHFSTDFLADWKEAPKLPFEILHAFQASMPFAHTLRNWVEDLRITAVWGRHLPAYPTQEQRLLGYLKRSQISLRFLNPLDKEATLLFTSVKLPAAFSSLSPSSKRRWASWRKIAAEVRQDVLREGATSADALWGTLRLLRLWNRISPTPPRLYPAAFKSFSPDELGQGGRELQNPSSPEDRKAFNNKKIPAETSPQDPPDQDLTNPFFGREKLPMKGKLHPEYDSFQNRLAKEVVSVEIEPWKAFAPEARVFPAFLTPTLRLPEQRLSRPRLQEEGIDLCPTSLHDLLTDLRAGEEIRKMEIFLSEPLPRRTYRLSVVVDLTTSMAAIRKQGEFVPLQLAVGWIRALLLAAQKEDCLVDVWASVDRGRRAVKLWNVTTSRDRAWQEELGSLHEVSLAGFRSGTLYRELDRQAQERGDAELHTVILLSDTLGHYTRFGVEPNMQTLMSICQKCAIRSACCLERITPSQRTQNGHLIWLPFAYAHNDILDALRSGKSKLFFVHCDDSTPDHDLTAAFGQGGWTRFRTFAELPRTFAALSRLLILPRCVPTSPPRPLA